MIYLQLFLSYLKIGFFGFGGGYAMLSLIQNEIVVQQGWLTDAQFADIVAVSQMTPGPIAINSATYIGYEVGGVLGSFYNQFKDDAINAAHWNVTMRNYINRGDVSSEASSEAGFTGGCVGIIWGMLSATES